MKQIIQMIAEVVLLACMTGCASTNAYLTDRGRDAADIFTVSGGMGLGAKARVGFIQAGWLINRDLIGLRSGILFSRTNFTAETYASRSTANDDGVLSYNGPFYRNNIEDSERGLYDLTMGVVNLPFVLITLPILWPYYGAGAGRGSEHVTGRDQFRPIGFPKLRGKEIDSRNKFIFVTHDSIQHISQIEVVVGLFGSLRLGCNPGEMVDFLFGCFGVDVFNDDIEMRPFKERRRKIHEEKRNQVLARRAAAEAERNIAITARKQYETLRSETVFDLSKANALLRYISAHPEDKKLCKQLLDLVEEWANTPKTIHEMDADQAQYPGRTSPHHNAFVFRSIFALDTLEAYHRFYEGIRYKDAVSMLGTPTKTRLQKDGTIRAWWTFRQLSHYRLRSSMRDDPRVLHTIQGVIDNDGALVSIKRTKNLSSRTGLDDIP